MIIYIDETEHDDFFIVAGLFAKSDNDIILAYKHFKNSISHFPLSQNVKRNVFLEFKSTILDKQYQRIKKRLLSEITTIDGSVIFSCYTKKQKNLKQHQKESIYISLLSNIINSIDENVDIVFDEFKNRKFEEAIISTLSQFQNVHSISKNDSQSCPGLQFADNICSVIRLHLTDSDSDYYYEIIESMVREA